MRVATKRWPGRPTTPRQLAGGRPPRGWGALVAPPGLSQAPPGDIPSAAQVMSRVGGENFPVALRILPAATRSDLLAIYGFARLVDQLGDDASGDRLAHLDWLEAELDRAYGGRAVHPVMVRLASTITALSLPRAPFCDLIEANRRDQRVSHYASYDELVDYCRYSANPVGRLVLAVFGVATPGREVLSDQVCTGLQLVEHTQDVGEDALRGRVYLAARDLERFGCAEAALLEPSAGPALRAVVALYAARARSCLDAGGALMATLHGGPRVAVAGFVAGGLASLDAIERADFDVLAHKCRPSTVGVAAHGAVLLARVVHRGGLR